MKYRIQHKKNSWDQDRFRVQYRYAWIPFWVTATEPRGGFGYPTPVLFVSEERAEAYIQRLKRSKRKYKTVEVVE